MPFMKKARSGSFFFAHFKHNWSVQLHLQPLRLLVCCQFGRLPLVLLSSVKRLGFHTERASRSSAPDVLWTREYIFVLTRHEHATVALANILFNRRSILDSMAETASLIDFARPRHCAIGKYLAQLAAYSAPCFWSHRGKIAPLLHLLGTLFVIGSWQGAA